MVNLWKAPLSKINLFYTHHANISDRRCRIYRFPHLDRALQGWTSGGSDRQSEQLQSRIPEKGGENHWGRGDTFPSGRYPRQGRSGKGLVIGLVFGMSMDNVVKKQREKVTGQKGNERRLVAKASRKKVSHVEPLLSEEEDKTEEVTEE